MDTHFVKSNMNLGVFVDNLIMDKDILRVREIVHMLDKYIEKKDLLGVLVFGIKLLPKAKMKNYLHDFIQPYIQDLKQAKLVFVGHELMIKYDNPEISEYFNVYLFTINFEKQAIYFDSPNRLKITADQGLEKRRYKSEKLKKKVEELQEKLSCLKLKGYTKKYYVDALKRYDETDFYECEEMNLKYLKERYRSIRNRIEKDLTRFKKRYNYINQSEPDFNDIFGEMIRLQKEVLIKLKALNFKEICYQWKLRTDNIF